MIGSADGALPTVVIVDDSSELRSLVRTRIRLSQRLRVVGEGENGAAAVELAAEHRPDLMLLDVSMPGMDGLEALPRVREASPQTRVVMFSGFAEQGLAHRLLEEGATAFLEKSSSLDTLADDLLALLDAPAAPPVTTDTGDGEPATHAEQQVVQEHLERFRELFEEAAIGMVTLTLNGRVVRVNRAFADLVGHDIAGLIGTPYADLAASGRDRVVAALHELQSSDVDLLPIEHDVAGTQPVRRVLTTMTPIRDSAGRPLYLFLQVQDVSATRAAEEELRRSEERFRLLVDSAREHAIFMLDRTGHVASWNPGAQRIKGYTAAEIIGQHFRRFYPPERQAEHHPEHELEWALRDGSYSEEGWRIRKDGSRFWAHVTISAVHNDAGEHVGFTKVTRDTTERREMQQRQEEAAKAIASANTRLEQANARLQEAADDQAKFLAVTAHELRTPVSVLAGSAETLARHWTELEDDERAEMLEGMTSSAVRLRLLLADLLTASRLQRSALAMHPRTVPVDDLLTAAVRAAGRTHPGVDVAAAPAPGLSVEVDADRISQALDNLVTNAVRHGAAPVRLEAVALDSHVDIRVSDAGSGVDDAVRERLFQRFVTGAARGGTGLGLFIVRELARAHGGDATYEAPSDGQPSGAFVLSLPIPQIAPDKVLSAESL